MGDKTVFGKLIDISNSLHCRENSATHSVKKPSVASFGKLDETSAEEAAEKVLDLDDYDAARFIVPIKSSSLFNVDSDDDEDESMEEVEKYWENEKTIIKKRFSSEFGLEYGKDYVLLNRGLFALLVFLTKNSDGEWEVPEIVDKYLEPDCQDNFLKKIDFIYRNTDDEFFCINAISATDKTKDCSIENAQNVSLQLGVQFDISFLRSETFKHYDSNEGRIHHTYDVFINGLMRTVCLEQKIVSFDSEIIDSCMKNSKITFRRK